MGKFSEDVRKNLISKPLSIIDEGNNSKKDIIDEINKIRNNLQNIFFEINKYKEFDMADKAQKGVVDVLDSVSKMQREIISKEIRSDKSFLHEEDVINEKL